MRIPLLLLSACSLVASAALPARAQTRYEIIRGRVTTDSGRPVSGATVRAQRAPDRAQKSTSTNASGDFSMTWPDGTGEYLVSGSASGLPTVSRRGARPAGTTASVRVF